MDRCGRWVCGVVVPVVEDEMDGSYSLMRWLDVMISMLYVIGGCIQVTKYSINDDAILVTSGWYEQGNRLIQVGMLDCWSGRGG